MGQFTGYKHPTSEVPFTADRTIIVRGLDIDDLSIIIGGHLDAVSKAADLYSRQKADIFAKANMQNFILTLAKDFPGLTMEVISIASDSPEVRDMRLPFPFQLRCLTEVLKLTMTDAGGMGNLFATLGALWKGARDAGLSPKSEVPSNDSIGASEKTLPS
jgi:hypothetical protein